MVDWNTRYYKYTHWENRNPEGQEETEAGTIFFLIFSNIFFRQYNLTILSPPLILHYLLVHPTLSSFSPPSLKRKSNKTQTKNPNKLKKKRQKKKYKNKTESTQAKHGVHCVPATYSRAGSVWLLCSPMMSYFHFPRRYQMQMASGLEAGTLYPVPLSSMWILFG